MFSFTPLIRKYSSAMFKAASMAMFKAFLLPAGLSRRFHFFTDIPDNICNMFIP